jgi:hypothetical protein
VHAYCGWLTLFEMVMTAAGDNPTQESFGAAAAEMSEIELPSVPFASLGPDKPDASNCAPLTILNSELGATGEGEPVGDLIDTAA